MSWRVGKLSHLDSPERSADAPSGCSFVVKGVVSVMPPLAPAWDELRQPVSSALGLLLSHGEGGVFGEPPQTAPPRPERKPVMRPLG